MVCRGMILLTPNVDGGAGDGDKKHGSYIAIGFFFYLLHRSPPPFLPSLPHATIANPGAGVRCQTQNPLGTW